MHDPFTVLGLDRAASAAEIKRAFRKLAMAWHPDRNPTREAEERFKHIKAAYELVLDPERLAAWDADRQAGADAAAAAGGEAPEAGAERKRRKSARSRRDEPEAGDDEAPPSDRDTTHLTLHLELEEAAFGCTRTITLASERTCPGCAGAGTEEHAHSVACPECKGVGRVQLGRGSGKCEACAGRGYVRVTRCGECGGSGVQESTRQLEVRIPPALLPGERLRLARQHRPREGGPASDLYVAIELKPHRLFTLDGRDLECTMPVGIFRLLHGGALTVPTLAGTAEVEIEAYPVHDLDYRFPGLGYPGRHGRGAGDLRLRLTPIFPRRLDDAERKLLARLDKAMLADAARFAPELADWDERLRTRR